MCSRRLHAEWLQSDELIRWVDKFVALNAEYPDLGAFTLRIDLMRLMYG